MLPIPVIAMEIAMARPRLVAPVAATDQLVGQSPARQAQHTQSRYLAAFDFRDLVPG
jgi:hypothetical protein